TIYFLFILCLCHHTPTTALYTLSLHDALPISSNPTSISQYATLAAYETETDSTLEMREVFSDRLDTLYNMIINVPGITCDKPSRSEEHTSELQSRFDLVCRLLLEKKKKNIITY